MINDIINPKDPLFLWYSTIALREELEKTKKQLEQSQERERFLLAQLYSAKEFVK